MATVMTIGEGREHPARRLSSSDLDDDDHHHDDADDHGDDDGYGDDGDKELSHIEFYRKYYPWIDVGHRHDHTQVPVLRLWTIA